MDDLLLWLPEGWVAEIRTRRNGSKYKCYIDPLTGGVFYSKASVLHYVQTGQLCYTTEQNKENKKRHTVSFHIQTGKPVEGLPPGWAEGMKVSISPHGFQRDKFYTDPATRYMFSSKRDAHRYHQSNELGKHVSRPSGSMQEVLPSEPIKRAGVAGSEGRRKCFEGQCLKLGEESPAQKILAMQNARFAEDQQQHVESGKSSAVLIPTKIEGSRLSDCVVMLEIRDTDQRGVKDRQEGQTGRLLTEFEGHKLSDSQMGKRRKRGRPPGSLNKSKSEKAAASLEAQVEDTEQCTNDNEAVTNTENQVRENQLNKTILEKERKLESRHRKLNRRPSQCRSRRTKARTRALFDRTIKQNDKQVQLELDVNKLPGEQLVKLKRGRPPGSLNKKVSREPGFPFRASKRLAGVKAELETVAEDSERLHCHLIGMPEKHKSVEFTSEPQNQEPGSMVKMLHDDHPAPITAAEADIATVLNNPTAQKGYAESCTQQVMVDSEYRHGKPLSETLDWERAADEHISEQVMVDSEHRHGKPLSETLDWERAADEHISEQSQIENTVKSVCPVTFPFENSWLDPCLEFAFKTLTDAIPVDCILESELLNCKDQDSEQGQGVQTKMNISTTVIDEHP